MSFEINHIRQNKNDQTVFFTLIKGSNSYPFHADVPHELEGVALEAYLTSKKNFIFLLILRKLYKGADYSEFIAVDKTELQAMQAWIQAGHKNKVGEDEEGNPVYEVIPKGEWKSTHPEFIEESEIDGVDSFAKLRPILKKALLNRRQ